MEEPSKDRDWRGLSQVRLEVLHAEGERLGGPTVACGKGKASHLLLVYGRGWNISFECFFELNK